MTATGFTEAQKRRIRKRDNDQCAWHGVACLGGELTVHHRANRGAGGRPSANVYENGLTLCHVVNGLLESSAEWARQGRARGVKISTFANPSEVPVWIDEAWWLLNPDGTRSLLTPDEAAELRALYGMGE